MCGFELVAAHYHCLYRLVCSLLRANVDQDELFAVVKTLFPRRDADVFD